MWNVTSISALLLPKLKTWYSICSFLPWCFCFTVHIYILIWPILDSSLSWSQPWSDPRVQKSIEATEVRKYIFVCTVMSSGSQQICEHMIREGERGWKVWCSSKKLWDCDMTGVTETDYIQNYKCCPWTFLQNHVYV